jgi:RNA-directed DNA polymerase
MKKSTSQEFVSGKNKIILMTSMSNDISSIELDDMLKRKQEPDQDEWASRAYSFTFEKGKLERKTLKQIMNKCANGAQWRADLNSNIRKYSKMFKAYNELSDFVRDIKAKKEQKFFSVYYRDDEMICFSLNSAMREIGIEFAYSFEDSAVSSLFGDILSNKDAKRDEFGKSRKIFCDKENYYQFIANPDILDLAVAIRKDELAGTPLYHEFKLTCKNGKVRDIIAPNDDIKPILQSINKIFQHVYDSRNSDFQVAYKPNKSIKDNARAHVDNQFVFKLDLHDFFPSCKKKYVDKYISFLFKNSIGSDILKQEFFKATLHDDALYIGNPVSGTLANTIISAPVKYIKRICAKFNIEFTVYADDMTFSSNKYLSKEFVTGIFNRAFVKYDMESDFNLNDKKSFGLSKNNRTVTGVVINDSNKMTCHRYIYNDIRQTLHQLSYGDESHFVRSTLIGHIAFMMSVDDSGKLKNLVRKYESTIRKYGLVSDANISKIEAA